MEKETTMSGILSLASEHCNMLLAGAVTDCDDGTQDLTVSFKGSIDAAPKIMVAIIKSLSERFSNDGDSDMTANDTERFLVTGIIAALGGEIVEE